ncbi:MAG: hypothetical protein F4X44_11235 [Gammaproteobacteria bacterium]|nr:hypothetical protein [Gammaproteobacteria bacterium]MYD81171.1 hypothetical protein [Gammaproteobacteria bacterium]
MKNSRKAFTTLAAACVFLGVALMPGCVSTTMQQVRDADTGIESNEAIAVLGRKFLSRDETESGFLDCVAEKSSSGANSLKVIPHEEFVDHLFPWFEPRTAPLDIVDMKNLVKNETIAQRLDDKDVRYIVWIEGTTERAEQGGTLNCAVATGGVPACFGFLSWEAESNYEAIVWDIRRSVTAGKVSSEARGMSFVPAIIIPIPFIARTQAHACTHMSKQLKQFIAGPAEVE